MMRRCAACGGFFDGSHCPNDHSHIEEYRPVPPPAYPDIRGKVVAYEWPSTGTMVHCVVVDEPDEDGKVGLMVLNAHVRVSPDDIEEI